MQGGYITAQHSVLTLREKWDLRTTVWLAGRGIYHGIIGRVDGALGRTLVGCGHVSRHSPRCRDMWASWRARCAAKLRIVASSVPHAPPEIKTAICFKVRRNDV
jgi:hypothetical protein